ncbi:hypothetical protein [Clostridium omnivorum]|uniref:Uncharacterized protein n=1 Tax=Clostridium omnivorum TaxID=1604902 RepID=A0ABQ5N7D0_9CLOT|nr:hypothetical protein [Clostridium sp. E14]GLC31137.1 hypothetical protein bsdE14_25470 [Clostridium sp. E14]
MDCGYSKSLNRMVIDNSVARYWNEAVYEWEIVDCIEDDYNESSCICGKENIKYLFTIKNRKNGNELFPIGSTCIKKFNREDLDEVTSVSEKLFQLLHAIQKREFISLNAEFFSRKLLKYLYDEGVFKPSKFNGYDGENDYLFMRDMFNKRKEPTENQQAKIKAIIINSIKPYLVEQLEDKIISK